MLVGVPDLELRHLVSFRIFAADRESMQKLGSLIFRCLSEVLKSVQDIRSSLYTMLTHSPWKLRDLYAQAVIGHTIYCRIL